MLIGLGSCHAFEEQGENESLPEKRDGHVPERLFAFSQVTSSDEKDGGGWWVGCLHLHLERHSDDDKSRKITCDLEFGFPIVTKQGRVSLREAQRTAADATNKAIAKVPRIDRMSVEICRDLHGEILRMADDAITGSRLHKKCGSTQGRVPEFEWP